MALERNIIVGAAAFFVAKNTNVTPAFPTLSAGVRAATTVAADTTNWRDVGFTQEGLTLRYEPDFGEVQVDQSLDVSLLFKQGMKVMLNTTFAEATLENLFVVYAQSAGYNTAHAGVADAVSSLEIQAGQLGEFPQERSLLAIGPAPRTATVSERIYFAHRALSMEASEQGIKRNEATVFPVSFRLLPLASTSNAYGKIVDRAW